MSNNNSFQVFKGGWDQIQNAILTDNQILLGSSLNAYFIRPDGTELFTLQGTIVETRTLSIPWDVDSAGSITNTFDVSTQDSNPTGLFFKDNGSKMFVLGSNPFDLFQYNLPTLWNVSTATVPEQTNSLSGVSSPVNIFFSRDGDFLYVVDPVASLVYRFVVPTPWDINTLGTLTSFNPGLSSVGSVVVKPEGDLLFISDFVSKTISSFILNPPFSLSSPTAASSLTVTQTPFEIFFRGNGSQLFIQDNILDAIDRFELEKEWDVSSASMFENDFPVADQPRTMFWKPDGLKMFEMDSSTDLITAYDGTTPFNTSTLTKLTNTFDVSNEETNPAGMFWSKDGTFLFVVGVNAKTVFKYFTNVPYSIEPADITSTPVDTFLIDTLFNASGIWFNSDGTIMLISETSSPKQIHQWNLSGPYVLPDDEIAPNFTLDLDEPTDPVGINPRDVFLKPDGLQMFLPDNVNDTVARYTLTTPFGSPSNPFDISTAKFADVLDLTFFMNNLQGMSMSADGKKIFVTDIQLDKILTFNVV